jgi:hypothetical protein
LNAGVIKQVLTVILGRADLVQQRGHLAKGALFLPEPEPLPEPFLEILLRVENAAGVSVELPGRVLQILEGRGIAVTFDDLSRAKAKLAAFFDAADLAASSGGQDEATFIFWGREAPTSQQPSRRTSTEPPSGSDERTLRKISVAAPALATDPAPPPAPDEPSAPPVIPRAPSAPADLELNDTAKLEAQLDEMSLNQKMQLAMKGDRTARSLLLKDPNKTIQSFILQNPRITLDEVKYLAGYRQANADVLNAIAAHRDWTQNPGVVSALVRNPKTPGPTAVRMMEKLPMAEIRRLAKSNDSPPAVAAAARKKVADPGARS